MGDTGSPVESSTEGVSDSLVNEQGIRNKRKFLHDTSLDIQGDVAMHTLTEEIPYYGMLEEKLQNGTLAEGSPSTIEEQEVEEFLKADWDDPIACQLQEFLIDNLLTVFKGAVKKICESGYTLEVAEWSILNSGLFHGSKDAVSNVVDGALALLKGEKELNHNSLRYSVFQEMRNLAAYTMLEMIHVLREVRPTLTIVESMWCLLISDLNLLNACVVDKSEISEDNSALTNTKVENSVKVQSDSNNPKKSQPENSDSNQPENSKSRPEESTPALQQLKGKISGHVQISSQSVVVDEKLGSFKKGSSGNSKRDMLRHKAIHLEKSCKGRISKAAFKAKVAAWGSMVMDKSQKTHSKITALAGPVVDPPSESKYGVPAPASPDKDPSPTPNCSPKEENTVSNPPKVVNVSPDETDETVLILVSHKLALEKELQGWSDWANEKVMQATKRLGKDRGELKMLRQEKEEAEKFEEKKQDLEEATLKRLSEMENALANATGQIEVANCSVRRLEEDSLSLKSEMKGVELEAMRSAKKLEDAQVREQEALKKVQLGETEKVLMVERLRDHKHQAVELEKQMEKAKERWDQFKLLLKHEEKEKARISAQVDSIRAKKQEERELTDKEAENIRQAAESSLQKCKNNIEELQKSISELRLEHNKSAIAALNVGYGSSMTGGATTLPKVTKRLAVFQDNFGGENIKPERECVMCMTEEISVVFLPCAHQILCGACSALHEKQGMNDCPSCRTPIQKRILAQYRD